MVGNIIGACIISIRDSSGFWSKKMGAPAGDLDDLMNLLALTNLIAWLLTPVCSGSLKAKSRENMSAKLAFLVRTFVEVFLAIKPAFWSLKNRWIPFLSSKYSRLLRTIEPTFCSIILPPFSTPIPLLPTTSLSSTLEANAMDNPIVFNIGMSDVAILLKP